jgi:hypothetical protein
MQRCGPQALSQMMSPNQMMYGAAGDESRAHRAMRQVG